MHSPNKKLRIIALGLAAGWLLALSLACGGSGSGPEEWSGTFCAQDSPGTCVTLAPLAGGTEATANQGSMNTISLTVEGRTSTTSECSWDWDRPSCDFAFGPSTITRPPRTPLTTLEFFDDYFIMTASDMPAETNPGTHWVAQ